MSKVRLRKLAPRLPYTFYRYHVDEDGESLLFLEQYGYRGNNFVNVLVPAEKLAYFVNDMEGAYFYGRSVLRAAYQHWYMKSQIYRIDAISIERNGLGVPTIKQGANVSAEDRKAAQSWVQMLAAHESTGLSLPNGWEFALTGVSGRVRDPQASIQHHSEMIMRSVLANFLTLGTTQTGSRALGGSMRDFFYLSLEAISRKIDETISNTCIRRLVNYNYGQDSYGQDSGFGIQDSGRAAESRVEKSKIENRQGQSTYPTRASSPRTSWWLTRSSCWRWPRTWGNSTWTCCNRTTTRRIGFAKSAACRSSPKRRAPATLRCRSASRNSCQVKRPASRRGRRRSRCPGSGVRGQPYRRPSLPSERKADNDKFLDLKFGIGDW